MSKNRTYGIDKIFRNYYYKIRSQHIPRLYLKSTVNPKLQIGSGYNLLNGWLNTDRYPRISQIAFLDASAKFPFSDQTFNFIYSEHTLEHLTFSQSCKMLSECYRVLKKDGVLRLAVPHIDFLFKLYKNPDLPLHKEYIKWAMERSCQDVASVYSSDEYSPVYVVNNFFKDWGHEVIHNFNSIMNLLERHGFSDVVRKEIGISDYDDLCGLEYHNQAIPEAYNKLETLVVEAKKHNARI